MHQELNALTHAPLQGSCGDQEMGSRLSEQGLKALSPHGGGPRSGMESSGPRAEERQAGRSPQPPCPNGRTREAGL